MRRFLKRVAAVVTAFSLAGAAAFVSPGWTMKRAAADDSHTHKICGDTNCTDGSHADITWTGINTLTSSTADGNYYLTDDVELSDMITIGSGKNITLCLNGFEIKAGTNKKIFQISNGTLNLCDCKGGGKLTGAAPNDPADQKGGAVFLQWGNFNMYGGEISGNTAAYGAGVYIRPDATFTMSGGTITGNTAILGGGVVVSNGTFNMSGGTIMGNNSDGSNYAANSGGGGVFIEGDGTFKMTGGKIISNTASHNGGGVLLVDGTFEIDGNVDIYGNITTTNSASNVFLSSGQTITIGANFGPTYAIGVSVENPPADCTSNVDVTGLTDIVTYDFIADNSEQSAFYQNKSVKLSGEHNWDAWQITKAPTTTQTGTASHTCQNDNDHFIEVTLAALDDTNVWTKDTARSVAPTATTKGKDVYTSIYGNVEVELPATGGSNDDDNNPGGANDNNPSGGNNDNNPSGGSNDNNPSGGNNDNNPSGGDNDNNPSGGSGDNNPSGGSNDNNPSGGSGSGGSSGGSSSSEIAPASDSKNPTMGSKTAVFSTAILAAAVMLLTKKRSR